MEFFLYSALAAAFLVVAGCVLFTVGSLGLLISIIRDARRP